ncbi:hypothetical protein HYZ98_02010 [Candidatus Peregrinibacteria bacterium]|nr:hypothetical protein [Candidatus Peregrinibacteria bacterium]
MFFKLLLRWWIEGSVWAAAPGMLPPRKGVRLLQSLDDSTTTLNPSPVGTIQIVYDYFRIAQQWIFGVAAGFCILNVLIGGFMILNSGGDPSKRSEGVSKALWSIAGLLLLAVVSSFMKFLNPVFYN